MKHWIKAFRLRTLPLALSCILAGHVAASLFLSIDWSIFTLCALTTILLQILSNLANDYGDSQNGADHEGREGPSRAVQSGAISKSAMKNAVILFSILSLISGLSLLYIAIHEIDWTFASFFILGLLSIVAAIKYTMGKNPYGYKAMGDVFVFLFFGLVGVIGSFWMQVHQLELAAVLPAIFVGLFSVGVLNMNNMRDVESDKAAGKLTIPIILGDADKWYHIGLLLTALISAVAFVYGLLAQTALFSLIALIPMVLNIIKVLNYKQRKDLDPELKKIALSTFLFCLVLLIIQTTTG